MATPHISAAPGDFAETVLMPGDPLRAKFIAENFLTDAQCVTEVRNMFGYTGTYKDRRISVMGSGMGIPSISIYAKELITDYDVKKIIRVGSCGAVDDSIKLQDIIIGMGASTDSKVNRIRFNDYDFAAIADYQLLANAVTAAKQKQLPVRVGNVFSSDLFYTPDQQLFELMAKYQVLAVEMEAAGLYGVAAEYGAQALAIFTVSDHITRNEKLSAEARQTSFKQMIELALDSVLLDK
ncbi:purine-nucleoside phosphorylase [Endozoicomonas sp. SM1973]|uniref:Purine nucleoside phosphorylase DeoD-type n=1 Tax=Spartinivicinus marinus TaxID=2994442 RepID=A0A853I7A7_9GAMM|nr:purine-nucleoside phosphorylase [Spartinivicinus marinus]MCX4028970.1 purine-nucleoside phosphorylase [Spartinivicinus marinus]NYZ65447.1 purine-nucleoside phosphorylase [Spartinivicinus marinus]